MKKIVTLLVNLLVINSAISDPKGDLVSLGIESSQADKLVKLFQSALEGNVVPTTTNTYNLGSSSKTFANAYIGTNLITSAQAGLVQVPYVPTMAATPASGTNDIKAGINIVPTAAANTAAILPPTPTAGAWYRIYNSGPNSVRVKAGGAATMNGATAGGYVVIATKVSADCYADNSGSNYVCQLAANPTPAGP